MTKFFYTVKSLGFFSIICILFFFSCSKKDKTDPLAEAPSYLSVTHAAPYVSTLQLFMDDLRVRLTDSLRFGSTTVHTSLLNPYIPVDKGQHRVNLAFSESDLPAITFQENFRSGKSYSLFILDTLRYGKLKYVLLMDDFKKNMLPGECALRFLNLSPNAPPLDLFIVQWRKLDTMKIAVSREYPAYNFNNLYSHNQFTYLPPGDYWMEARIANGGATIMRGGVTLVDKSIVTMYAKGIFAISGPYKMNVGFIEYIPE